MRVDRHLIFKALVALSEATHACREEPLQPDHSLRFVLAYLYTCSDGDRQPYDSFWTAIQDEQAHAHNLDQGRYIRSTNANGCLGAIIRGLQFEPTVTAEHILRDACKGDDPQESNVDTFWREVEKQVEMGQIKRPRPDCGWL